MPVRLPLLPFALAGLAFTVACASRTSGVAPLPVGSSTTTHATIGANGTTIEIAGPDGTAATITIAPVTVGTGSPVDATLTVPGSMAAAMARRVSDATTSQIVTLHLAVGHPILILHETGISPHESDIDIRLRLPSNQGATYSMSENARVTDSNNLWICSSSLNSSQSEGTGTNHAGAILELDNGINFMNPQGSNASIDATFVIETSSVPHTSRHRQDAVSYTCTASTSTLVTGATPTPTPTPVPTATPAPAPANFSTSWNAFVPQPPASQKAGAFAGPGTLTATDAALTFAAHTYGYGDGGNIGGPVAQVNDGLISGAVAPTQISGVSQSPAGTFRDGPSVEIVFLAPYPTLTYTSEPPYCSSSCTHTSSGAQVNDFFLPDDATATSVYNLIKQWLAHNPQCLSAKPGAPGCGHP